MHCTPWNNKQWSSRWRWIPVIQLLLSFDTSFSLLNETSVLTKTEKGRAALCILLKVELHRGLNAWFRLVKYFIMDKSQCCIWDSSPCPERRLTCSKWWFLGSLRMTSMSTACSASKGFFYCSALCNCERGTAKEEWHCLQLGGAVRLAVGIIQTIFVGIISLHFFPGNHSLAPPFWGLCWMADMITWCLQSL